jgi:glutamine amidotransferase
MSRIPIAIVDYGAGNLRSVEKALEHLGHKPTITSNPKEVQNAPAVIFPGQGIAGPCMQNLEDSGLLETLKERAAENKPLFGVCLGLQLLLSWTEEGSQDCLDVIEGNNIRFPTKEKVPHMGWNSVTQTINHPLFKDVSDKTQFYFVHSYYAVPHDDSVVIGTTEYQVNFASVITKGKLAATQFHPEKSGVQGLQLYSNFLEYAID